VNDERLKLAEDQSLQFLKSSEGGVPADGLVRVTISKALLAVRPRSCLSRLGTYRFTLLHVAPVDFSDNRAIIKTETGDIRGRDTFECAYPAWKTPIIFGDVLRSKCDICKMDTFWPRL
jgi:hypothetical protein